jgi:hypothetical protein
VKRILLALALVGLFAGQAFAGHCPVEMKKIDEALAKNPSISAAQMTEVKSLRAEGDVLHKASNHAGSLEKLEAAKKILSIQ